MDANELPEAPSNGLNNPKKRPREAELLPSDESPKRVRYYIFYEITPDYSAFILLGAYNRPDSLKLD